jgi:hypothetical protein
MALWNINLSMQTQVRQGSRTMQEGRGGMETCHDIAYHIIYYTIHCYYLPLVAPYVFILINHIYIMSMSCPVSTCSSTLSCFQCKCKCKCESNQIKSSRDESNRIESNQCLVECLVLLHFLVSTSTSTSTSICPLFSFLIPFSFIHSSLFTLIPLFLPLPLPLLYSTPMLCYTLSLSPISPCLLFLSLSILSTKSFFILFLLLLSNFLLYWEVNTHLW